MDLKHVDDAIIKNYRSLRTRIGILACAFPLVLVAVGYLWSIELQPTLSNYYFARDTVSGRVDPTPVRLWFCGILLVVSFFLFRYQGFSRNEDRWLSAAGLFAAGVAIFPMSIDGKNDYDFVLAPLGLTQLSLHGICAVLAFGCIAVVIVWYADSSLSEIRKTNPSAYARYKRIYRAIAAYMVISIVVSIYLNYAHHGQGAYILLAEASGIWAFAIYWFVKNGEMSKVGEVMKARATPLRLRTEADIADKL